MTAARGLQLDVSDHQEIVRPGTSDHIEKLIYFFGTSQTPPTDCYLVQQGSKYCIVYCKQISHFILQIFTISDRLASDNSNKNIEKRRKN